MEYSTCQKRHERTQPTSTLNGSFKNWEPCSDWAKTKDADTKWHIRNGQETLCPSSLHKDNSTNLSTEKSRRYHAPSPQSLKRGRRNGVSLWIRPPLRLRRNREKENQRKRKNLGVSSGWLTFTWQPLGSILIILKPIENRSRNL